MFDPGEVHPGMTVMACSLAGALGPPTVAADTVFT
jgi:hypothetical protein